MRWLCPTPRDLPRLARGPAQEPIMLASPRRPAAILLLLAAFSVAGESAGAEPVDYLRQVKPILKGRCYACHGALKTKGGLRLDTGEAIRRGGAGGPGVERGLADESLLVERVTEPEVTQRMPPEGAPLSDEQV